MAMTPEEYKAMSIKEFTEAAKVYDSGHSGIYEMCKDDYPPILEELAKEYDGKIDIYNVDTEKEQELAAVFGIRSIPTLLFVPMDAVLISQVLSNLLENAVVHGGGHTTEIRLSVRREGPEAVFAVEDNGDGIEQKVLPHLFDGTLAAAAGDTENGGKRNMGLGLSVCQAIIHAHSGSIEAHNLMEGAEFVFRLPLEQEEEKA